MTSKRSLHTPSPSKLPDYLLPEGHKQTKITYYDRVINMGIDYSHVKVSEDKTIIKLIEREHHNRGYHKTERRDKSGDFVTAWEVRPCARFLKGHLIGVVKGTLYHKTEKEIASMGWPILRISSTDHIASKSVDIIVPKPHQENPLSVAVFTSTKSKENNAKVDFVAWNGNVYMCIMATKPITTGDEIVIFSEEVSLNEFYSSYLQRGNSHTPPQATLSDDKESLLQIRKQKPQAKEAKAINDGSGDSPEIKYSSSYATGTPFQFNGLTLHHYGIIFHHPNQVKFVTTTYNLKVFEKTKKDALLQENLRRNGLNTLEPVLNYIYRWMKLLLNTFACDEVEYKINMKLEDIKTKINQIKQKLFRSVLVNDKNGVLLIMTFTPTLMNGLKMFFKEANKTEHLFDYFLNPLFKVERNKPQKIFPIAIVEGSTGPDVYFQNKNKDNTFQCIRWGPAGPNMPVLETTITTGTNNITKAFGLAFKDESVKKADLVKVMQHANKLQQSGEFVNAFYIYENMKPSIEHSTTEPFLVKNPGSLDLPLSDKVHDGYYVLIQQAAERDKISTCGTFHNFIVDLCLYLNVKEYKTKLFADDLDEQIQKHLTTAREEWKAKIDKILPDFISKMGQIPELGVTEANAREILAKFPGLDRPTLESLKWDEKYEITKIRLKITEDLIREAAEKCKKDKKSLLTVFMFTHGLHSDARVGIVPPPETNPDYEKYYVHYKDIIKMVKSIGVKKLLLMSAHCQGESDGSVRGQFKPIWPELTKGYTPHFLQDSGPIDDVKGEISAPQVGTLWASAYGTQLPRAKNNIDFSPLLDILEKFILKWMPGSELTFHDITQCCNKEANKDVMDLKCVSITNDTPEKHDKDIGTSLQFVYLNSFEGQYGWTPRSNIPVDKALLQKELSKIIKIK